VGVTLGALAWAVPCANLAFFEYLWHSFAYVLSPPAEIAPDHGIPPLIQAYFTILLFLWALFPFVLLFLMLKQKNWAKWIFIFYSATNRNDYFWFTYGTLTSHPGSTDFRHAFFEGQAPAFLLQAILLTAGIVLLSLPASNRRFKARADV
jgi:hypothetical protein